MPTRWAAFVEDAGEHRPGRSGPPHDVASPLNVTPALVELPAGLPTRAAFLDAQGLGWMHDLAGGRGRRHGHPDPDRRAPGRPPHGYDRLIGARRRRGHRARRDGARPARRPPLHARARAAAAGHADERHRATRPTAPARSTSARCSTPSSRARTCGAAARGGADRPDSAAGPRPRPRRTPDDPARPADAATPADAVALAFGLTGETAADLAAAAVDPEPELARAANQALWPATWGTWLTDPMSSRRRLAADRPRADRRRCASGSSTTSGPTARSPRCGSAASPTGCSR